MNDNTIRLLEQLATKLGTTVEHLWGILVRQAPVGATCELASCIALTVVVWWLIRRVTRMDFKSMDDDMRGFFLFILWLGIVCVVGWCLSNWDRSLPLIIAGFFNPEYWALKQILP